MDMKEGGQRDEEAKSSGEGHGEERNIACQWLQDLLLCYLKEMHEEKYHNAIAMLEPRDQPLVSNDQVATKP